MASCEKNNTSDIVSDTVETQEYDGPFLGFDGPITWKVDQNSTDLDYDQMLELGYDIYFVLNEDNLEVHGFTSPEKSEAWGDPKGYEVSQRHEFEREISKYVDENQLSEDSDLADFYKFHDETYSRLFEPDGPKLSARGTGLVWRGCDGDGGANQVLNTKPFFTQRSFRNAVSSFTGLNLFTRWTLYDRSWYRRSLGSWVVNSGGWTTLCGTNANDRTQSIVVL